MKEAERRLALTQNVSGGALNQGSEDSVGLFKTVDDLTATAKSLRAIGSELGITGLAADAAWDKLSGLASQFDSHSMALWKVATIAKTAQDALRDAKTSSTTLPEGDISPLEKGAIMAVSLTIPLVGPVLGAAEIAHLGEEKARARAAVAQEALNLLNRQMNDAVADLARVTVTPDPGFTGGDPVDHTYDPLPTPSDSSTATGVAGRASYTGSASSTWSSPEYTPSTSQVPVSYDPGPAYSPATGEGGAPTPVMGPSTSGYTPPSSSAVSDGTVTGVVPGSSSGSVTGFTGSGTGTGWGSTSSSGQGASGGALAGGMAVGGAALGAAGLGRGGAGLGSSGAGAAGSSTSGRFGVASGAGSAPAGSSGFGAGSRAGSIGSGAGSSSGSTSGLSGSTGSGLAGGSSSASASGAAAGSRAGAANSGMPMGGSGGGGAGGSKSRRAGGGGYLAPDLEIADDSGPVALGPGARAGSRTSLPVFAPAVETDPDAW